MEKKTPNEECLRDVKSMMTIYEAVEKKQTSEGVVDFLFSKVNVIEFIRKSS